MRHVMSHASYMYAAKHLFEESTHRDVVTYE